MAAHLSGHISPVNLYDLDSIVPTKASTHRSIQLPTALDSSLLMYPSRGGMGLESRNIRFSALVDSIPLSSELGGALHRAGRMLSAGYSLPCALDTVKSESANLGVVLSHLIEQPPRELFRTSEGRMIYLWGLVNATSFNHTDNRDRLGRIAHLITPDERRDLGKAISTSHNYLSPQHPSLLQTTIAYSQLLTFCRLGGIDSDTTSRNFSVSFNSPYALRVFGPTAPVSEQLEAARPYRILNADHPLQGRVVKKVHTFHLDAPAGVVLNCRGSPCAFMTVIAIDPDTLCVVQNQGVKAYLFDAETHKELKHGRTEGASHGAWEDTLLRPLLKMARNLGMTGFAIQSAKNLPLETRSAVIGKPVDRNLVEKRLDRWAESLAMPFNATRGVYITSLPELMAVKQFS